LATGELAAVLEPLAELGVISLGQRVDEIARPALGRRLVPARLVLEVALITRSYVLAHPHLVAREVLEDDADPLAQRTLVEAGEILAVEQNTAARR
jgi:hypothetical protein